MASSAADDCCVPSLKEPVKILTITSENASQNDLSQIVSLSDDASLGRYLGENDGYSCRLISICQRNSWRPLQVTSSMLSTIIYKHGFSDNVQDLTSCFYTKNLDLEDSFCIPLTVQADGAWLEVLYSIRYPEFKEDEREWSLRQTGICHRINTETRQSTVLLLTPKPNAKSYQAILEYLQSSGDRYTGNTWLGLHDALFKAHLPTWRTFNKSCEADFLPIANTTFATYIDEPLRVGYDQLNTLAGLDARFIKIISLVSTTDDLLEEFFGFLYTFPEAVNDHRRQNALMNSIKNQRRNCSAYLRTANFLKERVESASSLLANTLSFREQVLAKEQNGNMLQLNKSAVFITVLTLVYAPASFIATFFGMNFFSMDEANSRIVCTTMIWIYIVATFVFTGITVFFYYWLIRHDNVLFWRLAPRVHGNADWKALVRRLTKLDQPTELKDFHS